MQATITYTEISDIIKQTTNTDVNISFTENKSYPIHVSADVDIPVIGKKQINCDLNLIYGKKELFVFYDVIFIYKLLIPKVVEYLNNKGYSNYFKWVEDKKLFIINLANIEVLQEVFNIANINAISFKDVITTDFDINGKNLPC